MNMNEYTVKIPTQWLHMGAIELKKEWFHAIENIMMSNKPRGGLWASPYEENGEYLSDWHEASIGMGFEEPEDAVVFMLKEDARVCVIDNQLDLMRIITCYPAQDALLGIGFSMYDKYINFEQIKNDYDVIYLTEKGQWDTRLPRVNAQYNLYGWDCASCVILNFDVIADQKTIKTKQYHAKTPRGDASHFKEP